MLLNKTTVPLKANLIVSISAACLTFETQLILNLPFNYFLALFIFFATFSFYNFSWTYTPGNSDLKRFLKLSFLIPFCISLVFLWFLNFKTIVFLIPLIIICGLYALSVSLFKPIRHVPYLKIFLIAAIWGVLTVYVPALNNNPEYVYDKEVFLMFTRRFLFVFAITIPFDIRDLIEDQKAGIKTLPLFFGVKKSVFIGLIAMQLFSLLVIIHFYLFPLIEISDLMALLICAGIVSFMISKGNNRRNPNYYISLDAMMLLQFLLVYLFREIY